MDFRLLLPRVPVVVDVLRRALTGDTHDNWLERWLPLIADRSSSSPVLELGCGSGRDSAVLTSAGHGVVAVDLDSKHLRKAIRRVPHARFHCQDLRDPFPVANGTVSTVVASLSLHYFPTHETLEVITRIRHALQHNGILLCRLNSVNDVYFGARRHSASRQVGNGPRARYKHFFDRGTASQLFREGWKILSIEEMTVYRYIWPKVVWELCVQRV